ncbi:MAG: hypothetical protein AAFZ52_07710, partial [Bacteroidota bacterium]
MNLNLRFANANQHLGAVLLVGLALGVANYALGVYENLGQSLVLQVVISFLIGYPILVLAETLRPPAPSFNRCFLVFAALCFLVGLVGTEGQLIAQQLLFGGMDYALGQAGGVYLFNGILSVVLGTMTHRWLGETPAPPAPVPEEVSKIPIKQGDKTELIGVEEVLYFEAY